MLISDRQRKVCHLNMIYDGAGSVEGGTGWYLVVLGQYRAVLIGTWWNLDTMERYCPVLGGTGSVWGSIGQHLVVLDQYIGHYWLYWVSMAQYWLVLDGPGSV